MSTLLEHLRERVLLCDGAMGSRVQALGLEVEQDYWGKENCTEVLNLSRPELVREIHRSYFEAGADLVETNSFGGSPITLAEFELADRALEINRIAAQLAREAADSFADDRPRYVLGSIGPGTKLPSLGHIGYQALEDALAVQAEGLIAGGVDAILIETCQDLLQIKAAVNGARRAGRVPVFVQVTVETTGTLLAGADMPAAATVMDALDVPLLGINCATGPLEMATHVKWLAENWPGLIAVQPNAGLPELHEGHTHYPLTPDELAGWHRRFVLEDGINMVGGCCGTTDAHTRAVDAMLRELDPRRPAVKTRTVHAVPAVASLYGRVELRQENSFFSIGERCNANGSKRWRALQEAHDWEGCVAMAREQVAEGSNALDLCTAFVGRDEAGEMAAVLPKIAAAVTAPLVIDSTELPVLARALPLYGGKAIINSINFEDGEEPARQRLALARKFGAAVIALTIDEDGMAKTAGRKLEIARRLYDFAVRQHGLKPSDLLIDPLTFTIATGNADDRRLAEETLDGIARIHAEMPEVQIILGLSNVSFGLNAAARHVLNSVMLDEAQRRGLTGAIVHVSKIMPLHKIPPEEARVAEDLIFDRRAPGYDPLEKFISLFEGRQEVGVKKVRAETVEQRLAERIVDGDRTGLEADLTEALRHHPPLEIINTILLDGMKTVGELFGAGKMQLPFVLRSAETMKAAVAHLEPLMEKAGGEARGTIVLATVKGDVHDIGKNLVDIILTNNGYRVINLGIKQPIANILSAAREHQAHAIGMSGLLVKSTVVMRENLEELTRAGLEVPVLLGGAALTRAYVEEDCVAAYGSGRVAYAQDAFDGLALMDKVRSNQFDDYLAAVQAKRQKRTAAPRKKIGQPSATLTLGRDEAAARRRARTVPVPTPPFWGAKRLEAVPVKALLPFLNERMLFQLQWGYRKDGRSFEDYLKWAERELRPILHDLLARCEAEQILHPEAAYGFWAAAGEGDDLVLFEEEREVARFTLPRAADGTCIADYVRDRTDDTRDVVGLQLVTMGQQVAEVARDWFAANRYQDYLYLHGLSVELTEALAEYVHRRIRAELGFGHEDARDMSALLQQGYRGSRYSFGYPACPRLEDQAALLRLLGAERMGVTLSEEFQLHPEQSTSALVIHHPQARYFSV